MYSEAVDTIVLRTGRKDRLADIQSYVNQVIRETQGKALYYRDMIEDQIAATASPTIWTPIPRLRQLRTVKYTADGFQDVYPDFVPPGKKQQQNLTQEYYYAAGSYYVLSGTDASQVVNLAYYLWLPRLKYYSVGTRPAVYDETTMTWTYLVNGVYVSTTGSDAGDAAAQALVTNWILLTYSDMVEEGGCAKLFKAVSDARAPLSFALYKGLAADLEAIEQFETVGY